MDIYGSENGKIAFVLSKLGLAEESRKYLNDFKEYAENDKSIYKHIHLAMFYSYKGDIENAIEQMKLFSQEDNYFYWILVLFKADPLIDNIKDLPEFNKIFGKLETKFWKSHKQIKASLEEKQLL